MSNIGGGGNHLRWLCLLDPSFDLRDITQKTKLDFILQDVYSDDRDWYNWLNRESTHREALDKHIRFGHPDKKDFERIINDRTVNPLLYLVNRPETCYKHYLKFNSRLSNRTKEHFIKEITGNNQVIDYTARTNKKIIVMDGEFLFERSLNKDKISELNQNFNLEVEFGLARVVHEKWFDLNRKAEENIIRYMAEIYGKK